jgi:hypothetical protein
MTPSTPSRRTFLAAGLTGAAGLATALPASAAVEPLLPGLSTTAFGASVRGPLFDALGYRRVSVSRVYLGGLTHWTSSLTAIANRTDEVLWLSWKETNLQDVNNFFADMPSNLGCQVWGTPHHEPENETGSLPPAKFVDLFQAQAPLLRRHGVTTALTLMRYTLAGGGGRNWRDWWPGGSYVDVLGADSYNTGNKKGIYSDTEAQLRPVFETAGDLGKPWAIGETGALIFDGDRSGRSAWAADLHATAVRHGASAMAYWDQGAYALDAKTALTFLGY